VSKNVQWSITLNTIWYKLLASKVQISLVRLKRLIKQ